MVNIYQDNGYIDIKKILGWGLPFNLITGGRGTGKTFTALKTAVEDNIPFIFTRRTQEQCNLINKDDFSPFKDLNIELGWHITTKPITKYNSAFYNQVLNDGVYEISGAPIGYTGALSTFSNLRGFSGSDLNLWIYDEFIPEKHERLIKEEGQAFLNAYETINRNRELKGRKPLQSLCLSNANDLANPLFMTFQLVKRAELMRRKKQEVYINTELGICLIILEKSPISERKRNTALYRITRGTEFASMALDNNFASDIASNVKSKPIVEYLPVVAIGEICIYKHKSNGSIYVSLHKSGNPPSFGMGEVDRCRFSRQFSWIWAEYLENNVEFEDYLAEIYLTKAFQ